MKKILSALLLVMLSAIIVIGCKKNNIPRNYNESVKNKTWWGKLTNPGETAQYYSVYFNGDGNLTWSQRTGNYAGTWTLNDYHLIMDFMNPVAKLTADISNENTFKNITSTSASILNSGELIANPTLQLDNTVWKGMLTLPNGSQVTFQLNFLAGNKVEVIAAGGPPYTYNYTRSVSGAIIQFIVGAYPYFSVISSDTEMKGTWSTTVNNYFLWETTKQ